MDILNEKIEGLVKKAEKSKMPYGILKKVYDRGMAAWKTGHRPGTTPQQWAFARVNSFITKSSGTWGKADKDLAKQVRGEEVERRKTASEMLGQVREAVAQNDAFVVTGGPGDNAQKVIAVFKDKGNGLKDAKKARDNYDKKNKPTKPSHKARIYRQTRLSQAGQRLKPGEKIMYSTFGNKQQFTKVKEDIQVEEVDNSLMAQATRVISHTSIKEKIDPADVDNIATADDRKAADKNIIIQLRRAQDMQGKADVTFKDKPSKKEKIDIRVINKALDMFDKMRPNDKAKMQTMIGKSYRDLLKTVQRGRIWNTLTQKKTVLKKQSLRL